MRDFASTNISLYLVGYSEKKHVQIKYAYEEKSFKHVVLLNILSSKSWLELLCKSDMVFLNYGGKTIGVGHDLI